MPELEAYEIIRSVTGKSREEFLRDKYLHAPNKVVSEANALTTRRLSGEPLAYILGEWDFYGIKLKITKDVLIPRSDTEVLVDCALRRANGPFRFLDLGCGSGCIGIALALMRNGSRGVLADISNGALEVAKHNVFEHKLSSRLACVRADMLSNPPENLGAFDVIVSNPPYITEKEMTELDRSVSEFEPRLALCGGEDGLSHYRAIMENWFGLLREGGLMAFECGIDQSGKLEHLMESFGGRDIQTTRDTSGIKRVVTCFK